MLIGYARVSTVGQSVERQVADLQKAGAETIYADTGISGAQANRPELDKMLAHLRAGDEVIVTELSRIARSTTNLLALVEDLDNRGVNFRCLNMPGLDRSATGKLLLTILAATAQLERDLTIERINSGLANARAKGKVGGRPKALDAAAVAKAKALREKDVDVSDIAKTLGVSRSTAYKYLSA
jgi:DNA invertase Pin-like site-specific DNA recombinase